MLDYFNFSKIGTIGCPCVTFMYMSIFNIQQKIVNHLYKLFIQKSLFSKNCQLEGQIGGPNFAVLVSQLFLTLSIPTLGKKHNRNEFVRMSSQWVDINR